MLELPFQLLQMVFSHVSDHGQLLTCQLVSRSWNQASTKEVYTKICLNDEEQVAKFKHTISRNPDLRPFIKELSTGFIPEEVLGNLLIFVISYCPNIVKINPSDYDEDFWNILISAGQNDKLTHLQYLPVPHNLSLELYYKTAQAFRGTLKQVLLTDKEPEDERKPEFKDKPIQHMIYRLEPFTNITNLIIHRHSADGIMNIDPIIDHIPTLQRLEANAYPPLSENYGSFNPDKYKPHLNIKYLQCSWSMIINADVFAEYIVFKFPKLEHLEITDSPKTRKINKLSKYANLRFLHFMAGIHSYHVRCWFDSTTGTAPNYLFDFMRDTQRFDKRFIFEYSCTYKREQITFTPKSTTIVFPSNLNPAATQLPHIEWMKWASRGFRIVKAIAINNLISLHEISLGRNDPRYNERRGGWIDVMLNMCPVLQELIVIKPYRIKFEDTLSRNRHHVLEKLSLIDLSHGDAHSVVEKVCSKFPSLRYLDISNVSKSKKRNVLLNIKDNFLNTLTWEYNSIEVDDNFRFFIAVITSEHDEETFIMGDQYDVKLPILTDRACRALVGRG